LPLLQLEHAVVEEGEADVLVEGCRNQHHFQRFERIDGAVGGLAIDEHELLDCAFGHLFSPNRRSDEAVRLDTGFNQLTEPGDAEARARFSSRMPRRRAAATQTTRSSLCSAASLDQRVTMLRSSSGGSVRDDALLTPSL